MEAGDPGVSLDLLVQGLLAAGATQREIRQEILSGIRAAEQYKKPGERLRAFSDESVDEADYEEAATCFNRCRAKRFQGSNTDFLICSVSMRNHHWCAQRSSVNLRKPERSEGFVGVRHPVGRRLAMCRSVQIQIRITLTLSA